MMFQVFSLAFIIFLNVGYIQCGLLTYGVGIINSTGGVSDSLPDNATLTESTTTEHPTDEQTAHENATFHGHKVGEYPVNGMWSRWEDTDCLSTCGNGFRLRLRTCTEPPPTSGGARCEGPATKTEHCVKDSCPVINGQWSRWEDTDCLPTCECGTGYRVRVRTCTDPPPSPGGAHCEGPATRTEACVKEGCTAQTPQPPTVPETGSTMAPATAPSCNEYICKALGRCIRKSWKCDGDRDCPDNSDEPPTCPTLSTPITTVPTESPTPLGPKDCPRPYFWNAAAGGCIYVSTGSDESDSHMDADAACRDLSSGHLMRFSDYSVLLALRPLLYQGIGGHYFIDGTDMEGERNWTYSNGMPMSMTVGWRTYEPNNQPTNHCAMLYRDRGYRGWGSGSKWDYSIIDFTCIYNSQYICQI